MARKQFESVTVIGAYPSREVKTFTVDLTTMNILKNSGTSNKIEVDIFAPTGNLAKVNLMTLNYGAFGTASDGDKYIAILSDNKSIGVVYGQGLISNTIQYTYGEWTNAVTKYPKTDTALYLAQTIATFSDSVPLTIAFGNYSTTVDDIGRTKKALIKCELEKVV